MSSRFSAPFPFVRRRSALRPTTSIGLAWGVGHILPGAGVAGAFEPAGLPTPSSFTAETAHVHHLLVR